MAGTKRLICFPFCNGNLLDYAMWEPSDEETRCIYGGKYLEVEYNPNCKIVWHPREEVELSLTFDYISRGRSSAKANWVDDKGHEYPMFLTDLSELIKLNACGNKIHGIFEYVKRGCNYGIRMIKKL